MADLVGTGRAAYKIGSEAEQFGKSLQRNGSQYEV